MKLRLQFYIYKQAVFTLFILSLLSSTVLSGQQRISGSVIDNGTGTFLPYANIKSDSGQSISDQNGNFMLETSENCTHINISYIGFKEKRIDFNPNQKMVDLGIIALNAISEELNTVTITSGKFKKRIQDVTVSMEILKPELIENNHSSSFSDVLDKIPGVNYIDGQVNIRGGSGYSYGAGSRVMLLVDNLPALTSDAAYPNWSDIPVETIAQVEVLKGAGSALYGSAAMNGVINILTKYAKKEASFDIQTQIKGYMAPADSAKQWWNEMPYQYDISSSFAKKFGGLSVVAAAFYVNEKSYRRDNYNNYGRFNLKLDYPIIEELNVGMTANVNKGRSQSFFYWKNENEGAYLADSANYSSNEKLRYTIDPRISYFSPGEFMHRLNGRMYAVSNNAANDQSNFLRSYYGEYQIQKIFDPLDLAATGGIVSHYASVEAPLYGDTSFNSFNHAFYLQVEKKFFEKLIINAGARYEMNIINGPVIVNGIPREEEKYESRPVFRLGMNYKLFPFTNFRASWGQGYRYPSIAEKYISTTAGILSIIPNPELSSETGWTAELGVRQGFTLGALKGFADLSAFQSEYKDMIEFNIKLGTFPPKFAAQNIGNTIIRGFEVSSGLSASFGKVNWQLQGGYVYLDPKYKVFNDTIDILSSADENILKYRNKHSFKFSTMLEYQGFSIGIGSDVKSFMEAIDAVFNEFIPGVKQFRSTHLDGTQVWYASMGYTFKNYSLSLRLDNLFNEEYAQRPAQLGAPRSISLRLKYSI